MGYEISNYAFGIIRYEIFCFAKCEIARKRAVKYSKRALLSWNIMERSCHNNCDNFFWLSALKKLPKISVAFEEAPI